MSVREKIMDAGFEDVIYFDATYDSALIGISSNHRSVYDYEKMLKCLMKDGASEEEAMDWIDYNTIGVLPYVDDDNKYPIIIYSNDWMGI